ncbi:MAG: restriction endonuclease subunit S [Lactococcus chungangensis]|uniref:Restriction endonuclease subunit S n=1 Tax=Pseudolactococcus chungangensis TaxID=451457 RepID=A0A847J103_9LACT|nr:restriction endonuclease subunit S [Lactococcus chungangensis]
MSEQNKQVPRLRFPGFTDAWVKCTFEDLGIITAGGDVNKKGLLLSGNYPVLANALNNDGIIGYYDDYKVSAPAVTITGRGNIGHAKARKISYTPTVRLISLEPFNSDVDFLENLINTNNFFVESTGVPQLTGPQFGHFEVILPKREEQTKIGKFFQHLDNLITVNERELNKLKNLKKSYLEKMFPKNGSNIPELRFPGYTDAWVKCELGDVAEIVGGGTPSTSILEYWNGEINWYSPVEIGNQIYVSSSQNKITKLGLEKSSAKILPAYKTILFTSRAGIGNTAIMTTNGATNQGFQSLVIKEKTDLYFLYSISSKIKEMALQIASGSTFLEISGKSLSSLEILVPNFEEQTKIGKFFQHLDNLITVNERELKKLKELKKSYLNDMFV